MKTRFFQMVAALTAVVTLSACAPQSYRVGVAGNVANYREFSELMHSQQNSINSCFNAAGATNDPQALSTCAILAAGTNAQQTLAGRPDQIRVAKSPEEILETITKSGLDAAVKIYGFKQVGEVIRSGFQASSKDPLVQIVRPEIVQPEVVFVPQ